LISIKRIWFKNKKKHCRIYQPIIADDVYQQFLTIYMPLITGNNTGFPRI